ncbi:MAG: cation:proton antiporter [Bacteroidia bacterium]
MDLHKALDLFNEYNIWLLIIGLAILAITALPRSFAKYPFSAPMMLIILGYVAVVLPFGLKAPDPKIQNDFAEHLTEIAVIISLMGAGIKIDRKPSWKGWNITWRLLTITMILTIALTALVGWWLAAFVPASAILLGAVIAPTDPVIATEVQVGAPGKGSSSTYKNPKKHENKNEYQEDEVRFALTSEAGLNDGLAFPFTNLAVAMMLAASSSSDWFQNWLLKDVFYQIIVAVIAGLGLGYVIARMLLSLKAETNFAKAMTGMGALAATFIIYGITEIIGGYGFIATFIGAVVIRNYKRDHPYHIEMFKLVEKAEGLLIVGVLVALGAAIAGGLLAPINMSLIVCALLIIFIIRPVSGLIGLIGFNAPWRERLAISFFGIKGLGSLYYLSYALNKAEFPGADEIWALVALVIVISVFVHGITATPVTNMLDKMRNK